MSSNALTLLDDQLRSLQNRYIAPNRLDFAPSDIPLLLPTPNNEPFVAYRAALLSLQTQSVNMVVPPELIIQLALLRATICTRLAALDGFARAMYARRSIVTCTS
jgi:hypothetical protein